MQSPVFTLFHLNDFTLFGVQCEAAGSSNWLYQFILLTRRVTPQTLSIWQLCYPDPDLDTLAVLYRFAF